MMRLNVLTELFPACRFNLEFILIELSHYRFVAPIFHLQSGELIVRANAQSKRLLLQEFAPLFVVWILTEN
ncbi:MAG: hypothetical protein HY527_08345 [Betaproteobacteria bacterium]|nr:hypothetical protein [Betaproteobacteria bacterium]